MTNFVAVKCASGYDVVDAATGCVVGELVKEPESYVKPTWTLAAATQAIGARTTYRAFCQTRHGECSVKRMAETVWAAARVFRHGLDRK
jgi:hypothetical protein